jgi:hypothetical protein
MTPEEAKAYGLVDEVVQSRKQIPVSQPDVSPASNPVDSPIPHEQADGPVTHREM